jgi:hypothetical protein
MPKAEFNLSGYALVAERITEFYEKFENGRIITTLISRDETIVFRAEVYRNAGDALPAATGWASEREGDGEINLVACLENSETSAIGRALANLGFTASRKRPSYEEMEKAERARLRFQQPALRTPPDRSASGTSRRVAERTVASSSADNISSLTSDVLLLMKEAAERGVRNTESTAFKTRSTQASPLTRSSRPSSASYAIGSSTGIQHRRPRTPFILEARPPLSIPRINRGRNSVIGQLAPHEVSGLGEHRGRSG